ncbi:MmcQ/YjbR family DNA-binding protein [Arthrobacter sp. 08Y14]|uniref:MmcQ/YjbR family DNA-binding protein n=1 Tax=Arthrobacter sp. 08Y14 TaxID=2058885 RepID=UPI001CA57263|nr:MmcQ/YjbR family DNA-binding protein [Arthrobacter sp. 08Y14]
MARDTAASLDDVSHESITPGHYLDKRHWISVGPGAGITPELIEDLIYASYDLAGGLKPERS